MTGRMESFIASTGAPSLVQQEAVRVFVFLDILGRVVKLLMSAWLAALAQKMEVTDNFTVN
jgi:hypothetical protein